MDMIELTGAALLGSRDLTGDATFQAIDPATGTALEPAFLNAGPAEVAQAAGLAAQAYPLYRATTPQARAAFLDAIAANIEALGDTLIARAARETGLPV
ncbi:MAG: aldehyde dehydrogenase family protein, partial [Starkeya sp.]|nr:aldehyde dehydrogenase family protein [Starkeya sp.]